MKLNKTEKILIGANVVLGTVLVGTALNERRNNKMNSEFKKQVESFVGELDKCVNVEPTKELSPIERETIANQIKGMTEEEMRVTLENIPMDLIFKHIGAVLEKNRKFVQSINDAMDILK